MTDTQQRSTASTRTDSAYWYSDEAHSQRGRAVLQALRQYREAEIAMRKRTQGSMGMNETDLAALRNIMAVTGRGDRVSPKDLAQHLDISPASVSNLLERLEKSGHVVRTTNPDDARRVFVECTDLAHHEVRATLQEMHARMMFAVEDLTADEAATVIRFLERLQAGVTQPADRHSGA
ncbi:MarR family winged helix-turn-helix transcriptional regulator [uncultured Amnibacterium sp.]|uniref:MarR family winged helix-turn-helix transcriptional regulator n=1 Tax=uncultured Amnibacterium sp. TaxID=1631851 RepID=UPI0035CAEFA0